LLSGYAADELSDPERTAVKRHLCSCRRCESEVAGYREVLALAHTLTPLAPPPAAESRIRRALAEAVRTRLAGGSLDETTVERPLS
jgi:anti-sigma factor RsiW